MHLPQTLWRFNMVLILGENHSDKHSKTTIQNIIKLWKPNLVLHELLFEDTLTNIKVVEKRLQDCADGHTCDPRINKDVYRLALDLVPHGMKFYGIDLDEPSTRLTADKFFIKREKHMASEIFKHWSSNKSKRILVVVGDDHLRNEVDDGKGSFELVGGDIGSSLIIKTAIEKVKDVVVFRSKDMKSKTAKQLVDILQLVGIERFIP